MVGYGGKGNKMQKHKIQRITENTFTITTLPIQVQCHSLQYWLIWLLVALSNHDLLSTPPPVGVAEYCDERVCVFPVFVRLFVCMRVYLHDYIHCMSDLHQFSHVSCPLARSSRATFLYTRNLLFIRPRWQPRTLFLNNYTALFLMNLHSPLKSNTNGT